MRERFYNWLEYHQDGIIAACVIAFAIIIILTLSNITVNIAPESEIDPNSRNDVEVSVYTDTLTGGQYLGSVNTLTPRMDKNGHQIFVDVADIKNED